MVASGLVGTGPWSVTSNNLNIEASDSGHRAREEINDIAWLLVIFMVKVKISNAGGEMEARHSPFSTHQLSVVSG